MYIDIAITDVNDGGPSFASTTYTASIGESASIGASVTTVTASDPDNDDSTYGSLTYSILSGNTDNKFNINPNTGKISVAGKLNADTTSSYSLIVQAMEDSGDNSASATIDITVTDVNDNTPTCTSDLAFSVTKAEEGTIGDTIFSLVCSDADGDTITYTMSSGDSTYFEMSGADLNVRSLFRIFIPCFTCVLIARSFPLQISPCHKPVKRSFTYQSSFKCTCKHDK